MLLYKAYDIYDAWLRVLLEAGLAYLHLVPSFSLRPLLLGDTDGRVRKRAAYPWAGAE